MLIKGKQLRDSTIQQQKLDLTSPVNPFDAATKEYVDNNSGSVERYSDKNLDMLAVPSATTSGGLRLLTNIPLLEEPTFGSGVNVYVNGVQSNLYTEFRSQTNELRVFGEERIGDYCYLNNSTIFFDLQSDDVIDFIYIVSNDGSTSGSGGPITGADGVVDNAFLSGTILNLARTQGLSNVTVDLASISAAGTSGNLISGTYVEIRALADTNQLIQGKYYEITDYQTIHQIPNTTVINTGFVENIAILAIYVDRFADRAYSGIFLTDTILYDFFDDLAEDGITPRPGFIKYRSDTILKLNAFYDWRNVKFRRWQVNGFTYAAATHIPGTAEYSASSLNYTIGSYKDFYINFGSDTHLANPTLNLDSATTVGEERELIKDNGASFTANELQTFLPNSTAWVYYSPSFDKYVVTEANTAGPDSSGGKYVIGKLSWKNTDISIGHTPALVVDPLDFEDQYTFGNLSNGGNLREISISKTSDDSLNNIVFSINSAQIKQVQLGKNCKNMTMAGNNFTSFTMRDDALNNIFNVDAGWSNIDNEFQNNLVIGELSRYLITKSETYNNTWIAFDSGVFHHQYTGLIDSNTFRLAGVGGSGFLYFDGVYGNNYIYWPSANRNHIIGDMSNHSWEKTSGWSNITYLANNTNITNFDIPKSFKVISAQLTEYLNDPSVDPSFSNRSVVDKEYVDLQSSTSGSSTAPIGLSYDNKDEIPNPTTGNAQDTGITITTTPIGFVAVYVDGLLANLGNGVLTSDCYFSNTAGATARAFVDIVAGDALYWNGTIAGADLTANNRIDLMY